jgi:hypothetical protein
LSKNEHRFSFKVPVIFSDFNEPEFSQHIFKKSSNIKFRKHLFSGRRVSPRGETDERKDICDEGNSRFSQFCERASKMAGRAGGRQFVPAAVPSVRITSCKLVFR